MFKLEIISRLVNQQRWFTPVVTGLRSLRMSGKCLSEPYLWMGRYISGNQIPMIFQESMTSLNPVYSVGNQVGESIRIHRKHIAANPGNECLLMSDVQNKSCIYYSIWYRRAVESLFDLVQHFEMLKTMLFFAKETKAFQNFNLFCFTTLHPN